ncbi:hypothetical protein SPSIL_009070 [Sporomusa silvacetica DSM 10669]|uniref:Phage tail assembly protein n=1 Tax=Sporomusa silvacetica DSM 10669 TaxID=1123289 RepID=A0ABZ3IHF8_9FIRM|nr:phage tail assembly protein [Sporomusa silvacetica]OZC13133.1 hypothetical protein SPSIL_55890 [Sporomusa silvacetica DSM 10669]
MNTITLSKPISKDGNEITALNLDFDKITGNKIIAAEKEARLLGDTTPDACYSKTFQAILAAKAAAESVVVDDILGLSGSDFIQITNTVSNFLFNWALPVSAQAS